MNGACQARIEGTDHSDHVDGVFRVWYRNTNERLLVLPPDTPFIAGRGVLGRGDNGLVIGNLVIFDPNPVA